MVKLKQLLGHSSFTMRANLWAQGTGILVMLVTPNLLSVEEYAKVVYISFLLSFASLYDFGLTAVYNRLAPGLVSTSPKQLMMIESTLVRYLIFMSTVFSFGVSLLYLVKYENVLESFFILLFLPLSLIISFFITRDVVAEQFDRYYVHSRFQSWIKLFQIPFVFLFSITGWFISSLLANFMVFLKVFDKNIFKNSYDLLFIRNNLKEGLELSVKTLVWVQVLNFPRTFASLNYSDAQIANYGLINSMYQVVVSMSIAMFVPITVKIFKLFSKSDRLAFYYIKKVLAKTVPLFILAAIILALTVPEVISLLYPKYKIENSMVWGYFATVALFPTFFIIGIIYTGKKMNIKSIVISIIVMLCLYTSSRLFLNLNYAMFLLIFLITIVSYLFIHKGKR